LEVSIGEGEKECLLRIFRESKSKGDRGVTLIELAVVMAIIAIMGLFLAPALGEWIDNFRIRQAAREMSSDLQFARMKAISSGRYCTVVFNQVVGSTQYSYVIFPDYNNDLVLDNVNIGDINGDGVQENETTDIFKLGSLGKNISFDTAQGGGQGVDFPVVSGHPSFAFDRSGLPRDNSGSLTVQRNIFLQNTKNNKHQQITISPSGRIGINEY
jgi:prepilin-type N-terminal cleavage/methylation domain-containing protein